MSEKVHYPHLDGLRGIAILMVVGFHTFIYAIGDYRYPTFVEGFILAGKRGVELFFLISAFLLYGSLRHGFHKSETPLRDFYVKRFFRIFPFWTIAILLYGFVGKYPWSEISASLFMYAVFTGASVFHAQWSIFVEESFYLILPIVHRQMNTLAKAFVAFIAMWVIGILWMQMGRRLLPHLPPEGIERFPVNYWYSFALGICLFHAVESSFGKRLLRGRFVWSLATCIVLLQLPSLNARGATLALAILFLSSFVPGSGSYVLTSNRWLQAFGVRCYSIYLLHLLVIRWTLPLRDIVLGGSWAAHFSQIQGFLVWFPFVAMMCFAVSFVTYRLIEVPSVNWGRRVTNIAPRFSWQLW